VLEILGGTCGLGHLSRYSDSLRAGRSGDRIPMGARYSATVHTGPGSHPASYTMGTACYLGLKRAGRGVYHPPPSRVEVKKKSRAISLTHPKALVARSRVNLPFPLLGGIFCQFVGVKRPIGTVFYLRRASIFPYYTENAGIVQ
jgi:hypothetical protein